jgi:hypothetical protein
VDDQLHYLVQKRKKEKNENDEEDKEEKILIKK